MSINRPARTPKAMIDDEQTATARSSLLGILTDGAACVTFFSRLPVPGRLLGRGGHGAAAPSRPLAAAVRALPVAAVAIALPGAGVLWLASVAGFSPAVAAILAVATLIAATGALHEDGLADVADGFWGGHDKARILEIMRDSRIGTYGALALVVATGLRIALLAMAIEQEGPSAAAALFLAAAAASRTVLLYPWVALPPARRDGLAVEAGSPRLQTFRAAVLIGLLVTAALTVPNAPAGFLVGVVAAAAAASVIARLADRRIGGHTGDVLGATQQLSEIAFLAGVLISSA